MTAFLDTNVLIDVFVTRLPWSLEARVLWRAIVAGRCLGAAGASSITDFFYLTRRGGARRSREAGRFDLPCAP